MPPKPEVMKRLRDVGEVPSAEVEAVSVSYVCSEAEVIEWRCELQFCAIN
jgi:hypothetical protein